MLDISLKSIHSRENFSMKKQTDLRVLKNKQLIKSAFLELLSTKRFEDITVSQICQKALINRSTFYFHYENKVELLEVIYID
jgi:AcrR family transcriptional regulator